MTDDPWEDVARETVLVALECSLRDLEATVDPVGDAVYWGNDLDAEQIRRLRQSVHDVEYVVEEFLAPACEETEPWAADEDLSPSWARLPEDSGGDS